LQPPTTLSFIPLLLQHLPQLPLLTLMLVAKAFIPLFHTPPAIATTIALSRPRPFSSATPRQLLLLLTRLSFTQML
jgi:hypothetical protein